MANQLILIDGVKWLDNYSSQNKSIRVRYLEAICPQHNLRLSSGINGSRSRQLLCNEGDSHAIAIPRVYGVQKSYVIDKVDAQTFAQMSVLNIGDEAIPVAKEDLKDTDYWVRAKVTESKSGTRLIVWAGSKKDKNKAQLFVEPELKRMSFDQNDNHPNEVFTKVEAMFKDGISTTIRKDKQ